MYKPYGVLSQFTQPPDSDKETLASLGLPSGVYPIGRLDWDSEGLLLLSDDGALNHLLLDPSHGHERTYFVQVENIPDEQALQKLRNGVVIEGRKTLPAKAVSIEAPLIPERSVPIRFRKNISTAWIALTLTEGRNRQVRKMTAAVGFPTLRLVRASIGNLKLSELDLPVGGWTDLAARDLAKLFDPS